MVDTVSTIFLCGRASPSPHIILLDATQRLRAAYAATRASTPPLAPAFRLQPALRCRCAALSVRCRYARILRPQARTPACSCCPSAYGAQMPMKGSAAAIYRYGCYATTTTRKARFVKKATPARELRSCRSMVTRAHRRALPPPSPFLFGTLK